MKKSIRETAFNTRDELCDTQGLIRLAIEALNKLDVTEEEGMKSGLEILLFEVTDKIKRLEEDLAQSLKMR